jgi:hypothetical protein
MQYMKQQNEVENLLALIFQSGGEVVVKDGQLWVAPVEIAKRFGDQIRKLKPEILIALGHCPVCARELIVKVEDIEPYSGKTGQHFYCPEIASQSYGHYDSWKF